jgi:uncharacterized membrane protein YfbV (UPF0208 family)
MQKKNLELSRASQIDSTKDKILFRLFEILPGVISWSTLLFAIFFSYRAPNVVAIFIIFFDLFWLVRIFYLSFHQLTSFRELQKNLKIDWFRKLKTEYPRAWQSIYHLIILPTYKEKMEIIESSLKGLEKSFYPKNKMIVVLATEERGGKKAKEIAQKIKEKYEKNFFLASF